MDLGAVDWNRVWAAVVLLFVIVVGGIHFLRGGRA